MTENTLMTTKDFILSIISDVISFQCLQTIFDTCQSLGLQMMACQNLASNVLEIALKQQDSDFSKPKIIDALLNIHQQYQFDFAFQSDTPFYKKPKLVIFDVDMTFLQCEIIDELALLSGQGVAVKEITGQAMSGHLDFEKALRQRVALLKGIPVESMYGLCENFKYTKGIQSLIPILQLIGCEVGIISGGFDFLTNCLQKEFSLHYAYANQLEIEQGKLTGRLTGQIVDAQQKGQIVRNLANQQKLCPEQIVTVGDGANDLPMLKFAGLGVAFNAKPLVKRSSTGIISTPDISKLLYFLGFSESEQNQFKQLIK